MFNRIAIMGTGSLGTILGAFIAQKRQIDLIDVNKAHVDALNKNGAKVIGGAELTVKVNALTPDQMTGTYDLYFYMAKQLYNDDCIAQMKAHSTDKTIFCTCQNGLPETALVAAFGEERVMGCPIGWGATYIEPGVSRLTSPIEKSSSTLGTVTGKITPELEEVKKVLEYMCPITVSTNLIGLRWCKVLMNATFSGISTVMGNTFGAVMDDPVGLKAVTFIGRECVRAVAAAGIKMEPLHGAGFEVDFTQIFEFSSEQERQAKTETATKKIWAAHRALEASMLQDLQKGRRCEIDFIDGVVSVLGRQTGVPTPVCDSVVKIVKKIESGELKLEHSNLQYLEFPKDIK
jgi:2-dehydropantoate 2-reductase